MAQLEEGKTEVKRNEDVYKIRKGMLVVHQRNQNEELDFWRMIIPDGNTVKNFVITELYDYTIFITSKNLVNCTESSTTFLLERNDRKYT